MHKCTGCGTEQVHADDCPTLDAPGEGLPCLRTWPHPPHKYMFNRATRQCPGMPGDKADLYFCPTVGEIESDNHGGFRGGTCCAHPELHTYIGKETPAIQAISQWLSDKARAEYARDHLVGHHWAETIHTEDDGLLHIPVLTAEGTHAEGLVMDRENANVLQAMIVDFLGECYTPCDDDCDVVCHEAHAIPRKRHHPIGEHPSRGTALDYVTQAVARFDMDHMMSPEQPLPEPGHDFWSLWRAIARNAVTAYNGYIEASGHRYLSTACRHTEHGYCQSNTGAQGDKRPAECKFCAAKCVCSCHFPGAVPVAEEMAPENLVTGSDGNWCGADPPAEPGQEITLPDGTKFAWGDCDCTKPSGHDGDHECEPCTKRHGAPTWPKEATP